MQQDSQMLCTLIKQMGTPNDAAIRDAEEKITQAAVASPSGFINSLLEILSSNEEYRVKLSCCIWLQKALSPYQNALPDMYVSLTEQQRNTFKEQIFNILLAQTERKVKNQIADSIGEIGGGIYADSRILQALNNQDPWPELFPNTMKLFENNTDDCIEAALRILNNLTLYGSHRYVEHTETIKQKLQLCMESGSPLIKTKAAEVIGSLVASLPAKHVKHYIMFSNPMLMMMHTIIFDQKDIDLGGKMLDTLNDIIETEPKFFKANFTDLVELMGKIRDLSDVDITIKNQCLEIVISISQRYPEILKANTTLLDQVMKLCFSQMFEIPDETTDEWMSPPDGFNENDADVDEQNVSKFCMDCIDRLLSHVGSVVILPRLSAIIQELLTSQNWKQVHAGIMALSQIGEYMGDKPEEIAPIVDRIQEFIKHENPRIRYACCHCIGQLAEDLAPDFQILYHEKVLVMMAERLKDPVPRVLGHACASLTNHLEHCSDPDNQIQPHIEALFTQLWQIMESGSCYVRENVLGTISALSVGAGRDYFSPFYAKNMQQLLNIIENADKDEFKKLRGHAIECASITSKSVGKEMFTPFCDQLVQLMLAVQSRINQSQSKEDDPQMAFLLSGWQRISSIMKKDFYKYLDTLMPSLLNMCSMIVTHGKSYEQDYNPLQEEEEDTKAKISIYEHDNCYVAIGVIGVLLKNCGAALAPYVARIFEVIEPLMDYLANDSVREIACSTLPTLVLAMKGTQTPENIQQFSRSAMAKLWSTMDKEPEVEILLNHARAMQQLIENTGEFMTDEELGQIFHKCMQHLKLSDSRKQTTDEHKDEDEFDKDVDEVLELEKSLENEYHCQIAEIFGRVFKTHKARTLGIAAELDAKLINNSLQDNQPPRLLKFGLFLIDDIIDNLGEIPEVRATYFEKYYQQLIKFSTHPILFVRHAAVYGIGAMSRCVKGEFLPLYKQSLETLNTALEMPQDNTTEKSLHLAFKDNAKSAFGKVIGSVSDQLLTTNVAELKTVLSKWLSFMPLKFDLEEANIQHNMLISILTTREDLLIENNDPKVLKKVLYSFAIIYSSRSASQESMANMKTLLLSWNQDAARQQAITALKLEKSIMSQLESIVTAAN